MAHFYLMTESSSSFLRAARAGNLEKLLEYLKGKMDINTSNANGLNALHLAAKEGHIHVVKELLARGASVDAATKKGNTALHIASLAGQAEVVEILVQQGGKVNVQSQNGFTPLYMAAQENHSEVVKFLLVSGANQSLSTEDGFTPLAVALQQGHDRVVAVLLENDSRGKVHLPALHIAAKKDDVKATTLLLQNEHNVDTNKNGGLVNDTTKSGFTPLHIACHYGNINVGRVLIDKGADVNYKARNSITPLHVASKWGRGNMVELLLDAKASIDSRTRDGLTPLHCAARSGHDSVVDLLLERGALVTCKTKNGLTPLHMSSQGDHLDCARLLLYHKAPIDEVTVDYLTPLHVVAHCGNVKTAKLLLDRKCEVNARALNGFTPLHIACKKNRIKIVELLLKYGASIEATTESGLTSLHVASFMGHMNIVIFLIQHGSDPNHTTMRGETALHLAARANQTDIIRILLRNGAQVDHAKAREQQTALHISSRLGNVDNVLLLLQHGASPDAITKDFYTPLHIAAKEGHDEVVQVLLEHGAKQTLTTKRGFTPLHVAAKYGNLKVVQMLIQRGINPNLEGKNGLTPLHVATHYNRVNVALYLLEKNASPHFATKNGYTPLHIAAKKNQMDIATTLLEHGSNADVESRNGFTPLHLAAQEGHTDMVALLVERGADVNCTAKNGLTPLHLTAQEDHVSVAGVLVSREAKIDPQTKAGYTPLHTACHFGQIAMIRFLLEHGAAVNSTTKLGYTPLHQAAQQGHVLVNNLLLKYRASPNAVTNTGQTPLSIAQRLGYISVVEILKHVTDVSVSPLVMEEKYKVMFPETMQEAPISDSEEEGGEESLMIDQSFQYLTSTEKPLDDGTKDPKDGFIFERASENGSTNSSIGRSPFIDERKYSKEYGIVPSDFKGIKDDAMIMSFSECSQASVKMEPVQSEIVPYQYSSQEMTSSKINQYDEGDYYHYTSSFSGVSNAQSYETSVDFPSEHSTSYSGMMRWKSFLVSFMVDARGGAMRGCRHSGVHVIIPPGKACMPTRVTCRLVKKEKVMHPPALMEGEALASRILEMGPVGTKFSGPVIIEVPHFASLRGKEREITVLRSENGQTWREHTTATTEEAVQEALQGTYFPDLDSAEDLLNKRITRILTSDIPQYFAIVARVRQETSTIGPDGGMISSTVVPRVQAIFPEGSLTKNIKVGLQVLPVPSETVSKLLGNRVAVSPIVTVEPRRRKFHRPITLTIPVPMAAQKGMLNQYGGETPTLRLLCSIMGGTSPAQWEDITGTTPLQFINDCVSFTTTVSARFWLMDCQNVNESAKMASDLYHEIVLVPFMSRFVVFAKRRDPMEGRLHVFCMTDDKMDKLLENREHFKQVARSTDVEVLEAKPQYVEMGGNLVPVTKSGEKLCAGFRAFRENRLAFTVRVRDINHEAAGLLAFMREPKTSRSEVIHVPICTLTIALPDYEPSESPTELEELGMQYQSIKKRPAEDQISKAELWLTDIADSLGPDWIKLAHQMKIDDSDMSKIEEQYADDSEKALVVLHLWIQKFGERATGNELEKALRSIGHEDIVQKCMYNIEEVTDAVEKVVAKVYLDSSGFDALRDELGSSRDSSIPLGGVSLEASYEEQDILKESESLADESVTLDGNNIDQSSLDGFETAPAVDSFDEQYGEELALKNEDLNVGANIDKHRIAEEDSDGLQDISDIEFQSVISSTEEVLTRKEKKDTFAANFSESTFTDVGEGPEDSKVVARTNIPAQFVQSHDLSKESDQNTIVEDSEQEPEAWKSNADSQMEKNCLDSEDHKKQEEETSEDQTKGSEQSSEEKQFLVEVINVSHDAESHDIEIDNVGSHDQFHDKQDKVSGALPSQLMIMPVIQVQGASPMILSPTDEQSFTAAYSNSHGGVVDMEKVCEQAEIELAQEAEVNQSSSFVTSNLPEGEDKIDEQFPFIRVEESPSLDLEVCEAASAKETFSEKGETYLLEDQDDGVGISFEEDVGNVPLSPTDYSLMEESEAFSFDATQPKKDLFNEDAILVDAYDTQLVNTERLPSPSEYTLLTESVEGSEFNGAMEQMVADDVYSIPDPVLPAEIGDDFSDANLFSIQIDNLPESEPNSLACPPVKGTPASGYDEDQGFCGEEFEVEEAMFVQRSKDKSSEAALLNFPVFAPPQSDLLEKESVCIEEKDIDEKECEEVDLERPEKGEFDAGKEFVGEKLEFDDLDVELVFEFDGDELEDRKLIDMRQPPRVPFQTPVKTSPIDILFEFGQNSSNQNGSSIFLMQPEILERKLSRFNLDSSSPTATDENLDQQIQDDDDKLARDRDEFCVEPSGAALCLTADDDEASSSSNSEVAQLEEIGSCLQEPARQLKTDEKSEETDVDDAFSPCARDTADFDFARPLSLSSTVQSPLERISPTAEQALKEEVSPVTVLPERLEINVGVSPSEFTVGEVGMPNDYYRLGQNSALQRNVAGNCFRPIVEAGGGDDLEVAFQHSASFKPEDLKDEGFEMADSDEEGNSVEEKRNGERLEVKEIRFSSTADEGELEEMERSEVGEVDESMEAKKETIEDETCRMNKEVEMLVNFDDTEIGNVSLVDLDNENHPDQITAGFSSSEQKVPFHKTDKIEGVLVELQTSEPETIELNKSLEEQLQGFETSEQQLYDLSSVVGGSDDVTCNVLEADEKIVEIQPDDAISDFPSSSSASLLHFDPIELTASDVHIVGKDQVFDNPYDLKVKDTLVPEPHESIQCVYEGGSDITYNALEVDQNIVKVKLDDEIPDFPSSPPASLLHFDPSEPTGACDVNFVDKNQVFDNPNDLKMNDALVSEPHESIQRVYEAELLQTIFNQRTKDLMEDDSASYLMSYGAVSSESSERRETESSERFLKDQMAHFLNELERQSGNAGSSAMARFDPVGAMRLHPKSSASFDEEKIMKEANLSFHRLSMDPAILESFLMNQESIDRTESPSCDSEEMFGEELPPDKEVDQEPEIVTLKNDSGAACQAKSFKEAELKGIENLGLDDPAIKQGMDKDLKLEIICVEKENEFVENLDGTSPEEMSVTKVDTMKVSEQETEFQSVDSILENSDELIKNLATIWSDSFSNINIEEMETQSVSTMMIPEKNNFYASVVDDADSTVAQNLQIDVLQNLKWEGSADELKMEIVDEPIVNALDDIDSLVVSEMADLTIGTNSADELDKRFLGEVEELLKDVDQEYETSVAQNDVNLEKLDELQEATSVIKIEHVLTEKLSNDGETSLNSVLSECLPKQTFADNQEEEKVVTDIVAKEPLAQRALHPSDCSNVDQKSLPSRDVPSLSSEDVPKTSTSSDTSAEPTILAATYDLDLGAVSRVVATYDISPDSVEKAVTLEMQAKSILSSPDDEVFESELANGKSLLIDSGEVGPATSVGLNGNTENVCETGAGWMAGTSGGSFELVGFDDVVGYEEYLDILKQNQSFIEGNEAELTLSIDRSSRLTLDGSSVSAVHGSFRETEDESDEDTLNELRYQGTFHEVFTEKHVDYSDTNGPGEVNYIPDFDLSQSPTSHLVTTCQQSVRESGSISCIEPSENVAFNDDAGLPFQTFSSSPSELITEASSPALFDIPPNSTKDSSQLNNGSCLEEELLFDADGLSYLQSDVNSENALGREERHKTYAGKSALYSEATYQMFSTTEDTPDDYEDDDDDEAVEGEFQYYEEERSSTSEIQCEEPQISVLDNHSMLNFETIPCGRHELDETSPSDTTCLGSEDTEPELLALNDEDSEDLELCETFPHSVRITEYQDSDSSELPCFVNFHLSPGCPDVERPLSPVPDDSRRILKDEQVKSPSSDSRTDEEVEDKGKGFHFFQHIECFGRDLSDEVSENVDDQAEYPSSFDSENPDCEMNSNNVDLNDQATEFVNLVLHEAKLTVANDLQELNSYDDDTLVEPCGVDGDDYDNDVESDDDVVDDASGDGEFSIRMESCVQSFFNEQNVETVQTSSWKSYTESSMNEDGKPVSNSLTLNAAETTRLKDSKTIENAELISSVHSDTYSVDNDGKVIVKSKDVEETVTKTRLSEDKEAENSLTQSVELSKGYFDESNSFVTEAVANECLKHSIAEGHWEKCKETDVCSEEEKVSLKDPNTCESEAEFLHAEKRIDQFESCGIDQRFDETREMTQSFCKTEEQKMNFSENQDNNLSKFYVSAFPPDVSVLELSSGEQLSPENEGDSSSVDSFATVVPCQPDDRLSELSSVSSSFHSDVHAPFQDEPYISIDARDDEELQEGSTEHEDSSSSSDRFEVLERADLDSSVIEVLPNLDSPDELKYVDTNTNKEEFEPLTLATIREEEEKASLSGKSEKTSGSSDKVEVTSECSDRMTSSPELLADSPGFSVGMRFFGSKHMEKDNISVSSSLLEFERLEKEMQDKTSLDSIAVLSGENRVCGKNSDNDDVSISSSLAEFERLEGELTHSDSVEGISVEKLLGSTTSLNAFPLIDIGIPKGPQEKNLLEEQFEADAEKVVSMLEFGSLPLIPGPTEKIGTQYFSETPAMSNVASVASSELLASTISSYPQYQDIVQIIREASEGVENFEFGGQIADTMIDQNIDVCASYDDESDSEAVVTVLTNTLPVEPTESQSVDDDAKNSDDDDDDDDESESQSRSGTLDSELHTDQMSIMHASMDSFEFDSCPIQPGPELVELSEAAQLGRLLRSEIDAFSDIGKVTTTVYHVDNEPQFSQFGEGSQSGVSAPECFNPEAENNQGMEMIDTEDRNDDFGEENVLSYERQPTHSGKPMEQSSESGAWSQSDSLISTETVKSSDSTHDIMLVSLDSPDTNRNSELKQESYQETSKTGESFQQCLITDTLGENKIEAKTCDRMPESVHFEDHEQISSDIAKCSHSTDSLSDYHSYLDDPLPSLSPQTSDFASTSDSFCPDHSVCSSFSTKNSNSSAGGLMFITDELSASGDGQQKTVSVPSNQELSRADDDQVSRIVFRKQVHKKTIVQGGKEETVITEDTQIEQDENAPQELRDSVQELIQQFLDSNGEQGSTEDLTE